MLLQLVDSIMLDCTSAMKKLPFLNHFVGNTCDKK